MRYRSKPSVIEAVQWTGDNWDEVVAFAGRDDVVDLCGGDLELWVDKDGAQVWVEVPVGHWIVRQPGDKTDYWPVDPEYFAAKYEPDQMREGDV